MRDEETKNESENEMRNPDAHLIQRATINLGVRSEKEIRADFARLLDKKVDECLATCRELDAAPEWAVKKHCATYKAKDRKTILARVKKTIDAESAAYWKKQKAEYEARYGK